MCGDKSKFLIKIQQIIYMKFFFKFTNPLIKKLTIK